MPALSYQPAPFSAAQLPVAIDYPAALALRQMAVYTKVFALDVAARHRVQFSMPGADAVAMLRQSSTLKPFHVGRNPRILMHRTTRRQTAQWCCPLIKLKSGNDDGHLTG